MKTFQTFNDETTNRSKSNDSDRLASQFCQCLRILIFFSPSLRDDSQYLLFDADEMNYEDMFRHLKEKSDEQVKLAIYTKSIGKVITDRYVVDKEEMPYL